MKDCFCDIIGRSLSRPKVAKVCQLMELTEEETLLMLQRFCDRKAVVHCKASRDIQRTMVPILSDKMQGWISDNLFTCGIFTIHEQYCITSRWNKHQQKRGGPEPPIIPDENIEVDS